ncbi:accessory gland protein Acp76A [Drosophila eugracilis]|uniref:accessory gland protein Acp76A n=1 Tax=Drosophila eugracilis TaxID=29029 RepID=UPI0007E78100|nr:accessory gland protein Acp76A [Drosophila eugracilis]
MSKNFVISPFAIHQAITLLYMGKDKHRDPELGKALQLVGRRTDKILSFFERARTKAIQQDFVMANRIYLSPYYNESEHMRSISGGLGVEVENIPFSEGSTSGDEIEKWLNQTIDKGTRSHLFVKDNLTEVTQLVAVQGNSLSCTFKHRIKSQTTMSFSIPMHNRRPYVYKVQMMYTVAPLEFFNEDEVRGVMIPFSKTDIGMLVLIPRRLGTQRILYNLDKYLQVPLRKAEKTHLFLPIFSVQETVDFNLALHSLGINHVFINVTHHDRNENAAYFKQYNNLEVKPNRVLMQSEVGADNDQRVVNVNRPFVFVIKDENTIYMVGRMDSV